MKIIRHNYDKQTDNYAKQNMKHHNVTKHEEQGAKVQGTKGQRGQGSK